MWTVMLSQILPLHWMLSFRCSVKITEICFSQTWETAAIIISMKIIAFLIVSMTPIGRDSLFVQTSDSYTICKEGQIDDSSISPLFMSKHVISN